MKILLRKLKLNTASVAAVPDKAPAEPSVFGGRSFDIKRKRRYFFAVFLLVITALSCFVLSKSGVIAKYISSVTGKDSFEYVELMYTDDVPKPIYLAYNNLGGGPFVYDYGIDDNTVNNNIFGTKYDVNGLYFSGKTITGIRIPVKAVKSISKDTTFTIKVLQQTNSADNTVWNSNSAFKLESGNNLTLQKVKTKKDKDYGANNGVYKSYKITIPAETMARANKRWTEAYSKGKITNSIDCGPNAGNSTFNTNGQLNGGNAYNRPNNWYVIENYVIVRGLNIEVPANITNADGTTTYYTLGFGYYDESSKCDSLSFGYIFSNDANWGSFPTNYNSDALYYGIDSSLGASSIADLKALSEADRPKSEVLRRYFQNSNVTGCGHCLMFDVEIEGHEGDWKYWLNTYNGATDTYELKYDEPSEYKTDPSVYNLEDDKGHGLTVYSVITYKGENLGDIFSELVLKDSKGKEKVWNKTDEKADSEGNIAITNSDGEKITVKNEDGKIKVTFDDNLMQSLEKGDYTVSITSTNSNGGGTSSGTIKVSDDIYLYKVKSGDEEDQITDLSWSINNITNKDSWDAKTITIGVNEDGAEISKIVINGMTIDKYLYTTGTDTVGTKNYPTATIKPEVAAYLGIKDDYEIKITLNENTDVNGTLDVSGDLWKFNDIPSTIANNTLVKGSGNDANCGFTYGKKFSEAITNYNTEKSYTITGIRMPVQSAEKGKKYFLRFCVDDLGNVLSNDYEITAKAAEYYAVIDLTSDDENYKTARNLVTSSYIIDAKTGEKVNPIVGKDKYIKIYRWQNTSDKVSDATSITTYYSQSDIGIIPYLMLRGNTGWKNSLYQMFSGYYTSADETSPTIDYKLYTDAARTTEDTGITLLYDSATDDETRYAEPDLNTAASFVFEYDEAAVDEITAKTVTKTLSNATDEYIGLVGEDNVLVGEDGNSESYAVHLHQGSTEITFSQAFLNKLPVGVHKFTVNYPDDKKVSGTITILDSSSTLVEGGISKNLYYYDTSPTGQTVSILGDSISTLEGDSTGTARYKNNTSDINHQWGTTADNNVIKINKKYTWWGRLTESTSVSLLMNQSFRGYEAADKWYLDGTKGTALSLHSTDSSVNSGVSGLWLGKTYTFAQNETAANDNKKVYKAPNNVIVYLGTNDYGADANTDTFCNRYYEIIEAIHKEYPQTHIYCMAIAQCTNTSDKTNHYYDDSESTSASAYNTKIEAAINKLKSEYLFSDIDFVNGYETAMQEHYTASDGMGGIHPDGNGMKLIAEAVAEKTGWSYIYDTFDWYEAKILTDTSEYGKAWSFGGIGGVNSNSNYAPIFYDGTAERQLQKNNTDERGQNNGLDKEIRAYYEYGSCSPYIGVGYARSPFTGTIRKMAIPIWGHPGDNRAVYITVVDRSILKTKNKLEDVVNVTCPEGDEHQKTYKITLSGIYYDNEHPWIVIDNMNIPVKSNQALIVKTDGIRMYIIGSVVTGSNNNATSHANILASPFFPYLMGPNASSHWGASNAFTFAFDVDNYAPNTLYITSGLSLLDSSNNEVTAAIEADGTADKIVHVGADIDTWQSLTFNGTTYQRNEFTEVEPNAKYTIEIGGATITVTSGSTYLTFSEAFLYNLAQGEYDFSLNFKIDGEDKSTSGTIKRVLAADENSYSAESDTIKYILDSGESPSIVINNTNGTVEDIDSVEIGGNVIDTSYYTISKTSGKTTVEFTASGCSYLNDLAAGDYEIILTIGGKNVAVTMTVGEKEKIKIAIIGDSISTLYGSTPEDKYQSGKDRYYSEENATGGTLNETDRNQRNDATIPMDPSNMWFNKAVEKLGSDDYEIVYNYSTAGSKIVGDNVDGRVSSIPTDTDIVAIYMGTNDFGNDTNTATFKTNYETLISAIQSRCGSDVKIYCFTVTPADGYSYNNYNDAARAEKYSQIIRTMANSSTTDNIYLVELAGQTIVTAPKADGLHPNADGHETIAKCFATAVANDNYFWSFGTELETNNSFNNFGAYGISSNATGSNWFYDSQYGGYTSIGEFTGLSFGSYTINAVRMRVNHAVSSDTKYELKFKIGDTDCYARIENTTATAGSYVTANLVDGSGNPVTVSNSNSLVTLYRKQSPTSGYTQLIPNFYNGPEISSLNKYAINSWHNLFLFSFMGCNGGNSLTTYSVLSVNDSVLSPSAIEISMDDVTSTTVEDPTEETTAAVEDTETAIIETVTTETEDIPKTEPEEISAEPVNAPDEDEDGDDTSETETDEVIPDEETIKNIEEEDPEETADIPPNDNFDVNEFISEVLEEV